MAPATAAAGRSVFVAAVAVALPAALASGALLNRVWDLDSLLVATITYGGLALLIGGGFVATVVIMATLTGAAAPSALLPSIAATAVVAIAFAPVKELLSRGARRLVPGVRATPSDALVALPRQLADLPTAAEFVPRTADALARGPGVRAARVRAALPGGGEVVGWSGAPPADADPPELFVVEVRHLGRRVGDVAALPSADRPLGRRLLADLAAQAGPALRGVALAAESAARLDLITAQAQALRASRHRLATAQVAERQRVERDIHDGAQQKLVALAVRVAAAEALLAGGPAAAREAVAGRRAGLQD